MRIPGFTADASLDAMGRRYQSETRFSNGTNQVQMQKPNWQNTAGGACTGHVSGTTITGTYDSQGRCCTYPQNGFPFCIDCDTGKCWDRKVASVAAGWNFNFPLTAFASF